MILTVEIPTSECHLSKETNTNLPTFVEIREILLTLPPMQSMRDLDNLISDMRTVETLGDENSASE